MIVNHGYCQSLKNDAIALWFIALFYLDVIYFKIREEGYVKSKAIYILLAVNTSGEKEILGLYIADAEGANFWAGVLSHAKVSKNGWVFVQDILIACVDGLKIFLRQ